MKQDELDGVRCYKTEEKHTKIQSENLYETDHFGDLGLDGRMDKSISTRLVWSYGPFIGHDNETSGWKTTGVSLAAQQLCTACFKYLPIYIIILVFTQNGAQRPGLDLSGSRETSDTFLKMW